MYSKYVEYIRQTIIYWLKQKHEKDTTEITIIDPVAYSNLNGTIDTLYCMDLISHRDYMKYDRIVYKLFCK